MSTRPSTTVSTLSEVARGAVITALQCADEDAESDDAEASLAASAVSGQSPPAGPQWALPPLHRRALEYDKPQCASLDGFTLRPIGDHEARHAATRAGAMDDAGREALLRYVQIAQVPSREGVLTSRRGCS